MSAADAPDEKTPVDEAPVGTSSGALACSTRITYGDRWIHPGHPEMYDVASGLVTWDGSCVNEGTNSYAVLSEAMHVATPQAGTRPQGPAGSAAGKGVQYPKRSARRA